ncbi:MAG TPA: lipoyl(octanoyl) transferase LipB [Acidobacteriaceae bacterium]|jgi:lipoyl(octanoyl) transferase|nr:lipoyl(octanoyl) transferase LipB [Acidobacteriaceae bacterium]
MIQYLYLGRVGYAEGLALQQELVELRHQGRVENVLLLLEHPPVLTLGRNARRSNILATDEMLARKGVSIHEINRGGDVTYHGPGQLVGYPIFDLRSLTNGNGGRLGPVDYVRRMEEALIRLCAGYGVLTGRVQGRTGVWVGASAIPPFSQNEKDGAPASVVAATGREKKVGAIGVHVSRGITSHGFALNVTTDLRDFQWIVPCGIADREVTSLEIEIRDPQVVPSLAQAADAAARHFRHVFGEQVLAVESLEALRDGAEAANGRDVAHVGAPMRVPEEVRQLQGRDKAFEDRPVRA